MARQLGIMNGGYLAHVAAVRPKPAQSDRLEAWGAALESFYVRKTDVPVYEVGASVTVDLHAVEDGHKHMGTDHGKVLARGAGNNDDIYLVKLSSGHLCVANSRNGEDGKPASMKGIHESKIDKLDEENEAKVVQMFLRSHGQ